MSLLRRIFCAIFNVKGSGSKGDSSKRPNPKPVQRDLSELRQGSEQTLYTESHPSGINVNLSFGKSARCDLPVADEKLTHDATHPRENHANHQESNQKGNQDGNQDGNQESNQESTDTITVQRSVEEDAEWVFSPSKTVEGFGTFKRKRKLTQVKCKPTLTRVYSRKRVGSDVAALEDLEIEDIKKGVCQHRDAGRCACTSVAMHCKDERSLIHYDRDGA